MSLQHIPVLKEESISLLNIKPNGVYVDCTLGGGGHFTSILEKLGTDGFLIGIDKDKRMTKLMNEKLGDRKNVFLIHDNFKNIKKIITNLGFKEVDGILYDLGVSSYQLDEKERGFSYMEDVPLDMRMNEEQEIKAEDLVNTLSEKELTEIIREYGEEKWANRISKFIVAYREQERIKTTGQLVEIIKNAIPARARRRGPHPAKRTFQALRIAVNDEMDSLKESLYDAVDILAVEGRCCVISFHSLEDRIVKRVFKYLAKDCECPPGLPECVCNKKSELKILTKKPIIPTKQEIGQNPRSRSAKLRAVEKV